MIEKLSKKAVAWLLNAGAISADDRELYEYAVYSVLFTLTPLSWVFIIGLILGMPLQGVLFLLPFLFIRKFSGGFHFKSPAACFVTSITVLTLFLLMIRYVLFQQLYIVCSVAVVISIVSLFLLSPIDSEARRLSLKEEKVFRKAVIIISLLVFSIYVLLMALNYYYYAVPIGAGLILPAFLQLPCLFIKIFRLQNA